MSRNLAILIVIAYLAATSCKAECNLGDAMQVHEAPLPEDEDLRFDSKISKRSEGAVWSIYNDRAGKPQRLVHTDYGESGREVHRITIGDAKNYIITTHLYVYLAPLSYEGSNTIREEIDHYLFCDAKLDLPSGTNTTRPTSQTHAKPLTFSSRQTKSKSS